MARGDHIKAKRRLIWHHGIDLGNGKIIYFTGRPSEEDSEGKVRETSIWEFLNLDRPEGCSDDARLEEFLPGGELERFLGGIKLEIVNCPGSYDANIVVGRSRELLGVKGYNLLFNNCEHFAFYCKTGEFKSEQVETVSNNTLVLGNIINFMGRKVSGRVGYLLDIAGRTSIIVPLTILTHRMKNISQNDYKKEYSEENLLHKLKHYTKAAGVEVVGRVLQLYYAAKEPNTPTWAKGIMYAALGYFICPVDVICDLVPAIGYLDDLGVLLAAISAVTMYITPQVKEKAEQKIEVWFE